MVDCQNVLIIYIDWRFKIISYHCVYDRKFYSCYAKLLKTLNKIIILSYFYNNNIVYIRVFLLFYHTIKISKRFSF